MKHIKEFKHTLNTDGLQKILSQWNIKMTIDEILNRWSEPQRHYHTIKHLQDLMNKIIALHKKGTISDLECEKLVLIALFHDIVYEPLSSTNEEDSAKMFMDNIDINSAPNDIKTHIDEICQAILDTKRHQPSTWISKIFCGMDMSIVNSTYDELLEWENGIWNEFNAVGKEKYKAGRLSFLKKIVDDFSGNSENLSKLIEWVETNY